MSLRKVITLAVLSAASLGLAEAGTVEGQVNGPVPVGATFVVSIDDLESPPVRATAVMDQRGLRFLPHVLAVQVGTTVEFPNSDPVAHNVYSIAPAKRFNLGLYPRGQTPKVTFDRVGVVELLCNVHLEMSAYIVVLKNPYFALTGSDWHYRIRGVPAGRHRVRCWQESLPEQVQEVEVSEGGHAQLNFSLAPHAAKGARVGNSEGAQDRPQCRLYVARGERRQFRNEERSNG